MTESMKHASRWIKTLIPLLVFIIIALFLWRGLQLHPHRIPSPLINKEVPAFRATTLKTKQVILSASLKGQVSLLNVFATWCLSCRTEHPIMMDLYNRHLVNIYGLDYKDTRQPAEKWLAQYGNPYTKIIYDPTGKVGINLGVYGTPETFIIDQQGIIRYKYIGGITPAQMYNTIIPEIKKLQRGRA